VSRKSNSPPSASGLERHATTNRSGNDTPFVESWLRINPPMSSPVLGTDQTKEIEEDIVAELVRRHDQWISDGQ